MATAEQTQASEAFFTLVASAPGMPPLAGARMFAIGVHNCPSFAVFNNSMLYDAAAPLRFTNFLNVHLGIPIGSITMADADAINYLSVLVKARLEQDSKLLSSVRVGPAGGDNTLDYPSSLTTEADRNQHTSKIVWQEWYRDHDEIVAPDMRLPASFITNRRKAYVTGTTVREHFNFQKNVNESQPLEQDEEMAGAAGTKLFIRGKNKGESVLRFGSVSFVLRQYVLNEAAICNFTSDLLSNLDGPLGMFRGERKYLSKSVSEKLFRKYELVSERSGATVPKVIECLRKFEVAWQDKRTTLPSENPNKHWIELVSDESVWRFEASVANDDERDSKPCYDYFNGRCTRENCRFRHTGKAPEKRGGWNNPRGGSPMGSYVQVDSDGRLIDTSVVVPPDPNGAAPPRAMYQWVAGRGGSGKGKSGGKGRGKGKGK